MENHKLREIKVAGIPPALLSIHSSPAAIRIYLREKWKNSYPNHLRTFQTENSTWKNF